jgi:ABC-type transport system involved in Fe-S cluster assembly fused permease/ATPase subunit
MQLVCLARAALNDVPIVCMDEATAALDPHTEHAVLVRISEACAYSTALPLPVPVLETTTDGTTDFCLSVPVPAAQ